MATTVTSPVTEFKSAPRATKLLINNQWVASESGKTFPTLNPATGETIAEVPAGTAADVDRAVEHAGDTIAVRGGQRLVAADVAYRFIRSWTENSRIAPHRNVKEATRRGAITSVSRPSAASRSSPERRPFSTPRAR